MKVQPFTSSPTPPGRMRLFLVTCALAVLFGPTAVAAPSETTPKEKEVEAPKAQKVKIPTDQFQFGIVGSAQLDIIHDFNALGLDESQSAPREFITAQIPVGGLAADLTNRTTLTPNQSQLKLRAQQTTRLGLARAEAQFNLSKDIWGTDFRVYRVWGGLGYLRFGLDYTMFMNDSAVPDTLDFEGPQALPETRTPQVSLRFPIARIGGQEKKNLFFQFGLEYQPAEIIMPYLPNTATEFTNSEKVPATVGKFIFDVRELNLELAGVYRRLSATGRDYSSSVNGWGLYLSGVLRIGEEDDVMFGVIGGRGIAAYMDDTSGLALDAAPISFTNPDSPIKAIGVLGVWGSFQHFWHDQFRSTTTISYLETYTDFIDNRFAKQGPDSPFYEGDQGIYRWTVYSSANLIWSPISWFEAGVEYLFGYRKVKAGSSKEGWSDHGHDNRIQVSIRIKFDYSR